MTFSKKDCRDLMPINRIDLHTNLRQSLAGTAARLYQQSEASLKNSHPDAFHIAIIVQFWHHTRRRIRITDMSPGELNVVISTVDMLLAELNVVRTIFGNLLY